jgi:6-phosphogluconolactonase
VAAARGVTSSKPSTELIVARDSAELAELAAERFAEIAEEAFARAGRFTVALSGGSTPRNLYVLLATGPFRSRIAWDRTHFFWGDERCVPPTHGDSNYRMAHETLLRHLPIPEDHVHRIRGEDPDPDRSATEYEERLRAVFDVKPGALPRFDLILLGMGLDGHVASLFPGSPALREVTRLVAAPYVERLRGYRITLTLPLINEAANVLFLVSGRDKAAMLHSVLEAGTARARLPARLVAPRDGRVIWLVDEAAAELLGASARARQ